MNPEHPDLNDAAADAAAARVDAQLHRIEALFASADLQNARYVTRELEQLVRQLEDPVTRKLYEAAIDHLPDMLAHGSES